METITFEKPKLTYNVGDYADFEFAENGKKVKLKALITDIVICLHLSNNYCQILYEIEYFYKGKTHSAFIKKFEFDTN